VKTFKVFLKDSIETIKQVTVGGDKNHYALVLGIFFSFVITIEQLINYFFVDLDTVAGNLQYLLMAIFFFIIYLLHNLAYRRKLSALSKFLNSVFPYVVITLGILEVYNSLNFNSAISPFLFKLFIVSFMQVYNNKERNYLMLYSILVLNVMTSIVLGFNDLFVRYLIISFQGFLVANLLAYVIYLIYTHQREVVQSLDSENQKLEHAYSDLKSSHDIVESMFNLTQQILENEQIEDMMQLVLKESINLVKKAQAGSILIKDGDKMKFIAAKGYDLNNLKKVDLNFEDTFQANLENLYEPTIISDLETFDISLWGEEKFEEFKETHIIAKSCLTCSFKYKDQFFGSINLDNFEEYDIFKENDKYLIKKLAQEIEVILSIHKLYENALEPARVDGLTGIYNRSYVLKKLDYKINITNNIFSVCVIDINDLKAINDAEGHLVGDAYLRFFADVIKKLKREDDIIGRIGGDEFIVVFDDYDHSKTLKFLKKIKQYFVNNHFIYENLDIELKFGGGIAEYPKDGSTVNDLIKNADKKMYIDKLLTKQ
jgi:diguanylate cyclase (GGDEF)-like protein